MLLPLTLGSPMAFMLVGLHSISYNLNAEGLSAAK